MGMENPAAANMFTHVIEGGAGTFMYWLIVIGALAGLFTTWNGFFTASANLMMALARGRMVPQLFAKQNKDGVAVNGLILVLILSCCGPFLGANMINTVTAFSATAFILSWMITTWSLLKLRKTMPNANRPYKMPTGLAYFGAVVTTIYFVGCFIPICPWFATWPAIWAFLGYLVIGAILYAASAGQRKQLAPAEREKAMFGDLDLEKMKG